MLLEIPFIYEAKIEFPPRRKDDLSAIHWRDLHVGTTEIEIPEVSEVDAPLVLTARGVGAAAADVFHVRYHDGGFYYANSKTIGRGGVRVTGEMLKRGSGHFTESHYNSHPVLKAYRRHGRLPGSSEGEYGLTKWLSGEKLVIPKGETAWERYEEGMAAALSAIDPMMLIDGEVWVRRFEPTIVASIETQDRWRDVAARINLSVEQHWGQRHFGKLDRSEWSVEPPVRTQVYPMTDLALAVNAANGFGLPETKISFADLEIIAPEVLSFDASDSHIARTASQYLALLAGDLAGEADHVIADWLSVKKTLTRVQDGELEASALVPELEIALRSIRDNKARKEVLDALEFYDSMPVNVVQIPSIRPASPAVTD